MFRDSESCDFEDKIHRLAEELSKTKLRNFWISIDSAEAETHEQMRGLKGVIKGIEKALPIFQLYDIYPSANLGINRNTGGLSKISMKMTDKEAFYGEFKEAFENFYKFVINLGFTMVNACYPMSMETSDDSHMKAVYGAVSSNSIISFTKEEKIQLFKAIMDTIPKFRSEIRIFTPLVSLYSLIKQYEGNENFSIPCRGGIDFFFIEAKNGNTYPCGYRGNESLGKFYDLDIKGINAKPFCKACDWECFRDPSELIGFFIHLFKNPLSYMNNSLKDSAYRTLWREDLNYYKMCDYFDGRKPINSNMKFI
jgi:MoaA/NifB/PqqE/SkfB family radical SAM enzyme